MIAACQVLLQQPLSLSYLFCRKVYNVNAMLETQICNSGKAGCLNWESLLVHLVEFCHYFVAGNLCRLNLKLFHEITFRLVNVQEITTRHFWVFLGIIFPGCTVLGSQSCVFSQACGTGARTEVKQLFSSSVSSVPRLKLWMKLDKTFYFKKDHLGVSGKPLCLRSIIIFCFYPVLFCG